MVSDSSEKDLLRRQMLQRRQKFGGAERGVADKAIERLILSSWQPSWKRVLIYASKADEVATIAIIQELLKYKDRAICIPSFESESDQYYPSVVKDFENEIEVGRFGVKEPKQAARRFLDIPKLDVIFIPGLAFDLAGNRLGYGRGYFDKLCRKASATKIGLAYDFQIVDHLPSHSEDVPMNQIITEKRVISCQNL
jgi:5-formyltetrahydrofolate cyclo-ligase